MVFYASNPNFTHCCHMPVTRILFSPRHPELEWSDYLRLNYGPIPWLAVVALVGGDVWSKLCEIFASTGRI